MSRDNLETTGDESGETVSCSKEINARNRLSPSPGVSNLSLRLCRYLSTVTRSSSQGSVDDFRQERLQSWRPLICLTRSRWKLASSRLRDGGGSGKSFSNKKCKKRAGAGERHFPATTAPFPKSCASYFRFARFNTFPLYYLRAWHRLGENASWSKITNGKRQNYRVLPRWNLEAIGAVRANLPRPFSFGRSVGPLDTGEM